MYDPITCHGWSWDGFCRVCADIENAEYEKAMHENYQDHYVDVAEREYDKEQV